MKYRIALLLIVSLITWQCAKQTAPTGGAKDEIAPVLIRSNPPHEEINFKGKELQLTFDEFVQLDNPTEQIIITPSLGKKFVATAKKNKVTLKFNAPLQPNTTYSINFRESVQDITEKNPARVKLAISTGSYIDSLRITGKVRDALTEKEAGNYTVALAEETDTLNIFKHAASWITPTDKNGAFALENLKPSTYFIYAFDDKNKNLIVDSKNEKYAFKSTPIVLQKNIDSLKLSTFKVDASKLKLISSRPTFAYFNIRLSKSLAYYQLNTPDKSELIYSTLEPDLTTIKVYNTISNTDSLQVRLEAMDSTDSRIDTLIYVKFQKKTSTRDKFSMKIESTTLYESESQFTSIVLFNKPIINLLVDSVYIQVDSIQRTTFTKDDFEWNENLTKLTVRKRIEVKTKPIVPKIDANKNMKPVVGAKGNKNYNELVFAKGSIISVENDTATHITSPIRNIKPEDVVIVHVKVDTKENFLLQILNKTNQVVQEVKNKKEHKFKNLPAGIYLLRLLVDLNKNGKWDGGDYVTKKEPEPVIFYINPKNQKDIVTKANWVIGPLLIKY